MARGRFISESVAKDLRLNSLSIEAQLVYLMTIPHLDRDGLIEGDTDILYGTVCPKRRQFIDRMDEFIKEWVDVGLVVAYNTKYGPVLWFRGFSKNQQGLRYERETPSKFPPPPVDGSIRQESGKVPEADGKGVAQGQEQEQVKVEGKVEEKAAEAAAAAGPQPAWLFALWDKNMPGTKTPVLVSLLQQTAAAYSRAEIEEAVRIACAKDHRDLRYVQGILKRGAFSQAPARAAPVAPPRKSYRVQPQELPLARSYRPPDDIDPVSRFDEVDFYGNAKESMHS